MLCLDDSTLPEDAERASGELMREARMVARLRHAHVTQILGLCSPYDARVMLLFEMCGA